MPSTHTHSHVYSMCILYVFACLYSCTKYFTSVSSSLFYMNSSLRPIVFHKVFHQRAVSNLLLLRPNLQHGTAAPWGVGVFEVAEDLDGNATEVRLSRVVGEARDVCDLRSCASFLNCCLQYRFSFERDLHEKGMIFLSGVCFCVCTKKKKKKRCSFWASTNVSCRPLIRGFGAQAREVSTIARRLLLWLDTTVGRD